MKFVKLSEPSYLQKLLDHESQHLISSKGEDSFQSQIDAFELEESRVEK